LTIDSLDLYSKPAVLITDAYTAALEAPLGRKARDEQLACIYATLPSVDHIWLALISLYVTYVDNIEKTFRQGGCVLLPVDAAGRMLELVLCLHQLW
jgi:hypothetical protein